ncbi:hypothetical protein OH76DRAFT_1410441 [Lentinus brumalis]|uniref:Uncharacterized protein n=1 Tax=Lentinus brumalis TaxID=2498619 RepID=A0A371CS55_9APHY|nr:hypothetical protein OH76DRAFT_1410441 [Polyporus brumalis]
MRVHASQQYALPQSCSMARSDTIQTDAADLLKFGTASIRGRFYRGNGAGTTCSLSYSTVHHPRAGCIGTRQGRMLANPVPGERIASAFTRDAWAACCEVEPARIAAGLAPLSRGKSGPSHRALLHMISDDSEETAYKPCLHLLMRPSERPRTRSSIYADPTRKQASNGILAYC